MCWPFLLYEYTSLATFQIRMGSSENVSINLISLTKSRERHKQILHENFLIIMIKSIIRKRKLRSTLVDKQFYVQQQSQ